MHSPALLRAIISRNISDMIGHICSTKSRSRLAAASSRDRSTAARMRRHQIRSPPQQGGRKPRRRFPGKELVLAVFLLPLMLSPVAVSWMVGKSMMETRFGPLANLMKHLGWEDPSFLGSHGALREPGISA